MDTIGISFIIPDKNNLYLLPLGKKMLRDLCAADHNEIGIKTMSLLNAKKQLAIITAFHSPDGLDKIKIVSYKATRELIMIFIRNTAGEVDGYDYTLSYDAALKGKDYRVLKYSFDTGLSELKYSSLFNGNIHISDTGITLNIQSGDGTYCAALPSIYTINGTIDVLDELTTGWGSTVQFFNKNRIVGSMYRTTYAAASGGKYVEDTSKFEYKSGNRHDYKTVKGTISTGWFQYRQTWVGMGVMSRELAMSPEDPWFWLWDYRIWYRTSPSGEPQPGAYIGTDIIIPANGMRGGQPPYHWKTHHVVDVFDEDNALVITVQDDFTGGNTVHPYQLNLSVQGRRYLDTSQGAVFSEQSLVFVYNGGASVNDETVVRTERLMVGQTIVEEIKYTEHSFVQGNLDDSVSLTWIPGAWPGMTLVSDSGAEPGSYGDGLASASGSVSGYGIFNETLVTWSELNPSTGRYNTHIHPITIGVDSRFSGVGNRSLHIECFDNYNGAACFIVMYLYVTHHVVGTTLVPNCNNEVAQPNQVFSDIRPDVASRYIYWQTPTASGKVSVGSDDCRHQCCQIYNGYMVYTYNKFLNNVFQSRVIGIIEIVSGNRSEFVTLNDEADLSGFNHFHAAAIGLL